MSSDQQPPDVRGEEQTAGPELSRSPFLYAAPPCVIGGLLGGATGYWAYGSVRGAVLVGAIGCTALSLATAAWYVWTRHHTERDEPDKE